MDDKLREMFGDAVGVTLLTTVHTRAKVHEYFPRTQWEDTQAKEVWGRLESAAAAQGVDLSQYCLCDRSNMVGTVVRSKVMDDCVRQFAEQAGRDDRAGQAEQAGRSGQAGQAEQEERSGQEESQPIQVLSLGIGLCNRAHRLAGLNARWFGVDRPEIIRLRETYIPDDATTLIAGDLSGTDWLAELDPELPTIVVAEGLLMYLHEPEVKHILGSISDYFRGPCWFVSDLYHQKAIAKHPITKATGATFHFGVTAQQPLESYAPGWQPVAIREVMAEISFAMRMFSRVARRLYSVPPYFIAVISLRR